MADDLELLEEQLRLLAAAGDRYGQAVRRAGNTAKGKVQQTAKTEALAEYAIDSAAYDKYATVQVRQSGGDIGLEIRYRGRAIQALNFAVTPTAHGFSVRRKNDKAGAQVDASFIARANGNRLLFQRAKGNGPSGYVGRKPYKTVYGPSAPQMVDNEQNVEAQAEVAREAFEKAVRQEIDRIIK